MIFSRLVAFYTQLLAGRGVLFKSFTWIMGLRLIQQLLGLVGIYFLARGLETSTFGQYGILLSVVAICTIVTFPGLNLAIAQCTARGSTGIYRHALRLGLSGGFVGSVICAGAWLYFSVSEPELATAFLFAALMFPVSHGMLQWQSVLTGKEKFKNIFWLGGLTAIMTYSVIIVGIQVFPNQILVPVIAVMATPALMNILMTANTLNNTKSEISDASAVAYGIKSSIYLAINTIANHLDKLLLFYFLSADIVALYIVAERLSDLAKSVVQDFTAVLAPRFARLAQYTKQVDRLLKLIGLFFSVGILLLAFTVLPWAVVLIFSERYIEAIPVAQGLMVSVAIGIHATLRARYVTSKLDGVSVRDIYVTISIARIIFTCLLVPLFGLWGAVASAIMYRIASSVLVHFVIIKRYLPNE